MNSVKDLLLVAGGVALGYLVFKKDLFKRVEKATQDVVDGSTKKVEQIVNPKKAECETKWQEVAMVSRFGSQVAMEQAKEKFIQNCLS